MRLFTYGLFPAGFYELVAISRTPTATCGLEVPEFGPTLFDPAARNRVAVPKICITATLVHGRHRVG